MAAGDRMTGQCTDCSHWYQALCLGSTGSQIAQELQEWYYPHCLEGAANLGCRGDRGRGGTKAGGDYKKVRKRPRSVPVTTKRK